MFDQYLPATASLHVQATARSHECIDSMYSRSIATGLVELGFNEGGLCLATEARDPGAIDVGYPAPDFGSGGSSGRVDQLPPRAGEIGALAPSGTGT